MWDGCEPITRILPDSRFAETFILSDGMGGEAHGEVASALAVETIVKSCTAPKDDSAPRLLTAPSLFTGASTPRDCKTQFGRRILRFMNQRAKIHRNAGWAPRSPQCGRMREN